MKSFPIIFDPTNNVDIQIASAYNHPGMCLSKRPLWVIWKFPHRHLEIGTGIAVGIYLAHRFQ